PPPTDISPLSLHDALPILGPVPAFWTQKLTVTVSPGSITPFKGIVQLSLVRLELEVMIAACGVLTHCVNLKFPMRVLQLKLPFVDRKSTRLNSSHDQISYA